MRIRTIWGASVVLLAVAALAPVAEQATAQIAPVEPVIYAHRGGAAEAPENTLGAFRQTVDRYGSAVWLEMDTQLTADGQLVVLHDDDLDRTTTCTGPVIEWTYAELVTQACDASVSFPGWAAHEPVPLLDDVLAEASLGGWRLQIELKNIPGEANFEPSGEAAAQALAAAVESSDLDPADLQVQSFWPPSLDAFRTAAAQRGLFGYELVLLTTSTLPGGPEGAGFTASENAAFAAARSYEISAPDHRSVDAGAAAVTMAQALGRKVVHWTVDDPARIVEMQQWGVDGIITNAPGAALTALGH